MKSVIAKIRKDKGFTQATLAKQLNIPRTTLVNYEIGSSGVPTMTMLGRIAAALGVSIEELYEEDGVESSTEEAFPHAALG